MPLRFKRVYGNEWELCSMWLKEIAFKLSHKEESVMEVKGKVGIPGINNTCAEI